jgi:hypothetical protein
MSWPFVGRIEQLDRIRRMLTEVAPGPVMLLGEPGAGRSRLLAEALVRTPLSSGDIVLRVDPAGPAPFAALAGLLPAGFAATDVAGAAGEITRRNPGRRLVIAADDAHRVDQESMLVLRHLHRTRGALLLVTAPRGLPPGPDPLDCLRYEPDTGTVRLPPLSTDDVATIVAAVLGGPVRTATVAALHAATGGNPALLHGLVTEGRLADRMVAHDGRYQLAPVRPGGVVGGLPGDERLVTAVAEAWRELALDRADELCRLAAWQGLAGSVATTWAAVLLLRGRPTDGLLVLDAHVTGSTLAVVTRALLVGLGLRRPVEAEALLVDAAATNVAHRERLLACRAWLLAVTGAAAEAAVACESVAPGEDREATVFCRATRAVVALSARRPHEAVSHLRRALAAADGLRASLPWFPPYLTACLIDALLLARRISEATAEAGEFHAGRRGCGWNIAVAFDSLLTNRSVPAPRQGVPLGR